MIYLASLLALAAPGASESPPAAVTAFLSAVAAGDLRAARPTLSQDVVIMDDRSGSASSLEAFATYVRGCDRTNLTWDIDQDDRTRGAATVIWACPSRAGAEAFLWTDRTGIVHIEFGMTPAQ